MNAEEIKTLLAELLQTFRADWNTSSDDFTNHSEREEVRSAAIRSRETLKSLFPNHPELDDEFLSRNGENEEEDILNNLQQWANGALETRPGGLNVDRFSVVTHDSEECKQRLDELTRSPSEENRPAIWPFIKMIRYREPLLLYVNGLSSYSPGYI